MTKLSTYFKSSKGPATQSPLKAQKPAFKNNDRSKPVALAASKSSSLTSGGVNELDQSSEERLLRAFDLKSKYGPCIGCTRLERWERAEQFGLSPPEDVHKVLLSLGPDSSKQQCVWHRMV